MQIFLSVLSSRTVLEGPDNGEWRHVKDLLEVQCTASCWERVGSAGMGFPLVEETSERHFHANLAVPFKQLKSKNSIFHF